MSPACHVVHSEVAYDLLHDHLDIMLSLLEQPISKKVLAERVGSHTIVERMLKYGLVREDAGSVHAVADVFHQLRQEGMLGFLEHTMLPSLSNPLEENPSANLESRWLNLTTDSIRKLRSTHVQDFLDILATISSRPAQGSLSRCTVMMFGTSRLFQNSGDPMDEAMGHLKNAALQRTTADEKDQAVLLEFVFLADLDRYERTIKAGQRFFSVFDEQQTNGFEGATYHLTVATHWSMGDEGSLSHVH